MTKARAAVGKAPLSRRKQEAILRAIFEQKVPFNRVLGLKVVSTDPGAPRVRFDMRPELIGNATRQILHGGVIAAALDVVAGFAIHIALVEKQRQANEEIRFPNIGTVDLRVDYLRPGRGKHFIASCRVVRLGRRIAVTHMELVNDEGELIATGGAAYVVG